MSLIGDIQMTDSELGVAHGEGAQVLKSTLALLFREDAVCCVLNPGADVANNVLGSAYNDRHDGLLIGLNGLEMCGDPCNKAQRGKAMAVME
jgi:hypothetical protein